jgi:drug/metabolite transporter (DMT)-like permease
VTIGIILAILNKRLDVENARHLAIGVMLGFALAALQTISLLLSKKALLEGVHPLAANTTRLSFAAAGMLALSLPVRLRSIRIRVHTRDFAARDWLKIAMA